MLCSWLRSPKPFFNANVQDDHSCLIIIVHPKNDAIGFHHCYITQHQSNSVDLHSCRIPDSAFWQSTLQHVLWESDNNIFTSVWIQARLERSIFSPLTGQTKHPIAFGIFVYMYGGQWWWESGLINMDVALHITFSCSPKSLFKQTAKGTRIRVEKVMMYEWCLVKELHPLVTQCTFFTSCQPFGSTTKP